MTTFMNKFDYVVYFEITLNKCALSQCWSKCLLNVLHGHANEEINSTSGTAAQGYRRKMDFEDPLYTILGLGTVFPLICRACVF